MKLEKIKSTPERPNFNSYKGEFSYGQLIAIRDALAKHHADPLSDEMLEELNFFLDALPKPGEEFDKESKRMVPTGTANDIDSINIDDELPSPDEGEPEGPLEPDASEPEATPAEGPDDIGLEEPPAE